MQWGEAFPGQLPPIPGIGLLAFRLRPHNVPEEGTGVSGWKRLSVVVSSFAVSGTCAVQLVSITSGLPDPHPACPSSHFLSSLLRLQAQTLSSQG